MACLGLTALPEKYICDSCSSGVRTCFYCGQPGDLIKCTQNPCIKHYHRACAEALPNSKVNIHAQCCLPYATRTYLCGPQSAQTAELDPATFVCPLHLCANCELPAVASRGGRLARCLRCPIAYHTVCVPAGLELKVSPLSFRRHASLSPIFFSTTGFLLRRMPTVACASGMFLGPKSTPRLIFA
jgi:hypothetical protein